MITNREWWEFLNKAREFDINASGYADPRGGCINFWVGPDNKPEGYEHPITKAALNHPRNYLGTVAPVWAEDVKHVIAWKVSSTDYEGRIAFRGSKEERKKIENRPEHIAWVKEEFGRLHQAILGRPVDVPFVVAEEGVKAR